MGDDVPVRSILRWAVCTGAAIVAAWFGLGWIQARDLGHAQDLVSGSKLSPAQARQAASLLNTAGELNPDRSIDITRAQLEEKQGRLGLALAILEQVTHAEPDHLAAWRELAIVGYHLKRNQLAERAIAHVVHLLGKPGLGS